MEDSLPEPRLDYASSGGEIPPAKSFELDLNRKRNRKQLILYAILLAGLVAVLGFSVWWIG